MNKRIGLFITVLIVSVGLTVVPSGNYVRGAYFDPCTVPPVVGFASKPNVLIVMDYSGSMQFPAYYDDGFSSYYSSYVGYPGNSAWPMAAAYDPSVDHYGYFDSGKYYKYDSTDKTFVENDACPITEFTIQSSVESPDPAGITFTTPSAHTLLVGDYVRLSGLDANQAVNDKLVKVIAVTGTTFTVEAGWEGAGDTEGTVTKKVPYYDDPDSDCMCGDVLNWAVTSRIDAALKALIGGKADCPDGDDNCYTRPQGMKRMVIDNTELNSVFHVRPGEVVGGIDHPSYYKTGHYLDKYMYLSMGNHIMGNLGSSEGTSMYGGFHYDFILTKSDITYASGVSAYDGANPGIVIWTDVYKFTITNGSPTRNITVQMEQTTEQWEGGNGKDPVLFLFKCVSGTCTDVKTKADGYSIDPSEWQCVAWHNDRDAGYDDYNASLTKEDLEDGTYFLVATKVESGSEAEYQLITNIALQERLLLNTVQDRTQAATFYQVDGPSTSSSKIGAVFDARVRVKVPATERKGVIQESFDSVRFGFMYYKSDIKDNKGKIVVGCHNDDVDKIIAAFEGIDNYPDDGIDFTKIFPYWGTPTGDGLEEAYDYFNQHSNSDNADNSLFTAASIKKTANDPYYGVDASGTPHPVPCRKSFVLVISDGEWNVGQEPTKPALKMHTDDARPDSTDPDLPGDQVVDVFSIFAFGTAIGGSNSMKAIAMYGSFSNVTGCGNENFPYPKTGTPSDSKNFTWPVTGCDPNGTYEACCEEWDSVWDRDEDEVEEHKGIPDNYFEASDGAELEAALRAVLESVVVRNASAGAVATISQEVAGKDIFLRGAFKAADPDKVNTYFWFGHLEAYWPFEHNGEWVYSFELACNADLLCFEMPGTDGGCPTDTGCWDAAEVLNTFSYDAANPPRKIFSWLDDDNNGKVDANEIWDLKEGNWDEFKTYMKVTDETVLKKLISWIHGKSVGRYRSRLDPAGVKWILGDIVYSTPVIVGTPPLGAVSPNDTASDDSGVEGYWAYRNSVIATLDEPDPVPVSPSLSDLPKKMIYVGGNDGMLHAFVLGVWDWSGKKGWVYDPNDAEADPAYRQHVGKELWAYIPSNLLRDFKKALAKKVYGTSSGCLHRTMVDLSPHPWQVYIDHDGDDNKEWRTVIIGGERGGGDVYFAIDVTDPDDPKLLWEYSALKDLVEYKGSNKFKAVRNAKRYYWKLRQLPVSWSRPMVGRVHLPEDVKFHSRRPNTWNNYTPVEFDQTGKRHIAFAGGGFRVFDTSIKIKEGVFVDDLLALLRRPYLLALDVETGENLFRHIWPRMHTWADSSLNPNPFEPIKRQKNLYIPFAFSDTTVLDLWRNDPGEIGDDGYADHIYVGDTVGHFYSMKLVGFQKDSSSAGLWVDLYCTKAIDERGHNKWQWSDFRSIGHPMTVRPVVSVDKEDNEAVRVIFGTGKYDDILGSRDDKTDPPTMSLYNLKETIDLSSLSGPTYTMPQLLNSSFDLWLNIQCSPVTLTDRRDYFEDGCTWIKSGGTPDCCQTSCADPCWDCVYDLTHPSPLDGTPGERFTSEALIAGGLVFVTSYLPPEDLCSSTGTGYLYIFDYLCNFFAEGFNPLSDPEDLDWGFLLQTDEEGDEGNYGVVVKLGAGMPSMPVLDSSGEHVIIQMATADILRIGVNLPDKPMKMKGWKEIQ